MRRAPEQGKGNDKENKAETVMNTLPLAYIPQLGPALHNVTTSQQSIQKSNPTNGFHLLWRRGLPELSTYRLIN